jgi:hypothetical protein
MTDPTALLEAAKREAHAAIEQLAFPYSLDSRHPTQLRDDTKAALDRALRIAERVGEIKRIEALFTRRDEALWDSKCDSDTARDAAFGWAYAERDRLLAELEGM